MNETKSARYHRASRRAGAISLAWGVVVPLAALYLRPSLPLWQYVIALALAYEAVALPITWYRTFLLERRYELSTEPLPTWLKDHAKAMAIAMLFALVIAEGIYVSIRWRPADWWLWAAISATAATVVLARVAPVALLPLFYTFTPLERPDLVARLVALSKRAGVPVLGVFEMGLGAKTRRANAALVGSGATRRILLSDTLLANYTDDEIEVILAHELGHHVHHDIAKGLLLEFVVFLLSLGSAAAALKALGPGLGLTGPADPAGLPVVILAIGTVSVVVTPLLHAISRLNERRADRFALALTQHRDPFITAMKRLGSQNMSEENPSRLSVWLFHTHPPIEDRIAAARRS